MAKDVVKLGKRSFSLHRMKNRLYGGYNPKDLSFT